MTEPGAVLSAQTFVADLGRAWKRLSLYPKGHPLRAGVLTGVVEQLAKLTAPTGAFAFGVGRESLLTEDQELGGGELADPLYRRNVAVVRFLEGVDQPELETFLALLRHDGDTSLWEELATRGVSRIELDPVDLSNVVATDSLSALPQAEDMPSLWERILRLELEGRSPEAAGSTEPGLEQVIQLFRRLLERETEESGTGEASGARITELGRHLAEVIEAHLRAATRTTASASLVRQVTDLLAALPQVLRQPVLDAAVAQLAGRDGDGQSLEALTGSADAAQLVGSLRRLRDGGFSFAPEALTIIDELVTLAPEADRRAEWEEHDPEALARLAERELDSGLASVVDDFALRLPRRPSEGIELPDDFDEELRTLTPAGVTQGVLTALLRLLEKGRNDQETGRAVLLRLEAVFADLVVGNRAAAAGALVRHLQGLRERADGEFGEAVAATLERLAGERTVALVVDVLGSLPERDWPQLRLVVEPLGRPLLRRLLIAQSELQELSDRRHLFDFLRPFSTLVVEDARELLADERWYLVRNMLSLLTAVGDRTSLAGMRRCMEHEDSRVRQEAVKGLSQLDASLPSEIVERALADDDQRVAERMIQAVGARRMRSAVRPLLELLGLKDQRGRNRGLRLRAIESLGRIGDPAALPELRRFFASGLVRESLDERRAAFASLAGYPSAARQEIVAKGAKSRDPEIRRVCRQLIGGAGNG